MILIISIQKRKRLFHTGYSSAKSTFLRQGSLSIIGKAEKPLPHNNNTMKKLILARGVLAASLFCCMSLGNTACVNRIDEESEAEIEEGTTPITFSIKIEKASTKSQTPPLKRRQMGLFATTSSGSIKGKRYIDNLALEYTEGSTLIPQKTVFYPEGDVHWTYQLPPLPNRRGSCRYTRSSRICTDRPKQ